MRKLRAIFIVCLTVVTLLSMSGCTEVALDPILVNIQWILESIHYSDQNTVTIEEPFSLFFKENGEVDMEVDCNTCLGMYETGANDTIAFIGSGNCSEAYCGDDSLDREFMVALENTSTYVISGDRLFLYFNNGSSYLLFSAE